MSKQPEASPRAADAEAIDADLADFDNVSNTVTPAGKAETAAITELQDKITALQDQLARAQAEMANNIKRSATEVEKTHKYATERFARALLDIPDNLERALAQQTTDEQTLRSGVELTLKVLHGVLEKNAIKVVNPLNEAFDPNTQEAMSMQETTDAAPGTVLSVLQKGYTLHERLLRPALVVVAKAAQKN